MMPCRGRNACNDCNSIPVIMNRLRSELDSSAVGVTESFCTSQCSGSIADKSATGSALPNIPENPLAVAGRCGRGDLLSGKADPPVSDPALGAGAAEGSCPPTPVIAGRLLLQSADKAPSHPNPDVSHSPSPHAKPQSLSPPWHGLQPRVREREHRSLAARQGTGGGGGALVR